MEVPGLMWGRRSPGWPLLERPHQQPDCSVPLGPLLSGDRGHVKLLLPGAAEQLSGACESRADFLLLFPQLSEISFLGYIGP